MIANSHPGFISVGGGGGGQGVLLPPPPGFSLPPLGFLVHLITYIVLKPDPPLILVLSICPPPLERNPEINPGHQTFYNYVVSSGIKTQRIYNFVCTFQKRTIAPLIQKGTIKTIAPLIQKGTILTTAPLIKKRTIIYPSCIIEALNP